MSFRTDRNSNPTAFTTDIAKEAGLIEGVDYEFGESFEASGDIFYTAKLIDDPLIITIKVIDKIGFYNSKGVQRWVYIAIPYKLWLSLTPIQKKYVIGYMYKQEGGTEMQNLFPQSL